MTATEHARIAAQTRWSDPPPEQRLIERFNKNISFGKPLECWTWIGNLNPKGYGRFRKDGRSRTAHRIAWEIRNGRIAPRGIDVGHTCHNRNCVNPDHLILQTRSENMLLSSRDGRLPKHRKSKK